MFYPFVYGQTDVHWSATGTALVNSDSRVIENESSNIII